MLHLLHLLHMGLPTLKVTQDFDCNRRSTVQNVRELLTATEVQTLFGCLLYTSDAADE